MMQHSYDKSNNVFYYRDRGRKVATSATIEGLDKKLIDLGYKVKPRKEATSSKRKNLSRLQEFY